MSGFMILCGNCGKTVKLTNRTNVAKSEIVVYDTGISCGCGNCIEIDKEHVVQTTMVDPFVKTRFL